jgi:uncharacterized membrane protein
VAVEEPSDLADYFAEADRRERERLARRAARSSHRRKRRPPQRELAHLAGLPAGRLLIALNLAIALATVGGLIALWPGAVHHVGPSQAFGGPTQTATVSKAYNMRCPGPTPQTCRQLVVNVRGHATRITLGPVNSVPKVSSGDRVRVSKTQLQPGVRPPPGWESYQFVGISRQGSLLVIGLVLAGLAFVLLRWRGLLALAGVGLSVLLLVTFVVPAILTGESAVLVALVGSLAVMFVTLVLTNGVGAQMLAASLGITTTLVLLALVTKFAIGLAHLDGNSSDLSLALTQQNSSVSLTGVVLAGMVIGGLGVLADTAVTQASAVMALRRANPGLTARGLYRGASAVGRDHVSATIHTLVLAYAGTSLPLLLVMRSSGLAFGDALNAQDISEPIVATCVGCIGLIAAVPLTTGLASMLVSHLPAHAVPDGHGHHH